ncbi:hypothetical protein ERUR111494_04490 [Erysipelothrix urinaevulpis]|uniref:hypothetical protein n=1 Tax=Erysipelothrix urinaevulpis TaxID=2683717 RepID=UPI001357727D|nr:hypothetical protein [Erysipelothrix urinaevulpis]
MIKDTIYINRPVEEVWTFIVEQFALAFDCNIDDLEHQQVIADTINFTGKTTTVHQEITELKSMEKLVMKSENSKDIITSSYHVERDDEGTFLSVSEEGVGKDSKLRSLNFSVFTLPILRRGSKKKIRRKLETMKQMLESE